MSSSLSDYEATLYHVPMSSSCRVLWAYSELGLSPPKVKMVDFVENELQSPSFRSLNPMCNVPVMVLRHRHSEKQEVLTEGSAILQVLSNAAGRLQPPSDDLLAYGKYLRFCTFAPASMQPPLLTVFNHESGFPEHERLSRAAELAREDFRTKVVPTLESAIIGDWICGPHYDEFTMADILVGSALLYASIRGLIDDSDKLRTYLSRCMQRKAFKDSYGTKEDIEHAVRQMLNFDEDWKIKL